MPKNHGWVRKSTSSPLSNFLLSPDGGVRILVGSFLLSPDGGVCTRVGSFLLSPDGGVRTLVGSFLLSPEGGVRTRCTPTWFMSSFGELSVLLAVLLPADVFLWGTGGRSFWIKNV